MKKYLVLSGHAKAGNVYGKPMHDSYGELDTLDTMEDAERLEAEASRKWPHMLYWIIVFDFEHPHDAGSTYVCQPTRHYAKQAIRDATTNRFPCGCLVADALLCTHGNSPLA